MISDTERREIADAWDDPVDHILAAVSELYQVYHRVGGNETERRIRVEEALGRVLDAWNKWLG